MKYMGSKNRIAKHLLPIMLKHRQPWMPWVEPFVGGANMIDKVSGVRIGNDSHKELIALHKAMQSGWVPPTEVTEDMYYHVKKNPEQYSDALVGFVGFLCSFGGRWWEGYARDKQGRNYAEVGSRSITKQAKKLIGVEFVCGHYSDMEIPPNSLIYCDPPYAGTKQYKRKFNHAEFWEWCRDKAREGHVVFVSEYNAPDDFECLKTIEHKTGINVRTYYKTTEKLFRPPLVNAQGVKK